MNRSNDEKSDKSVRTICLAETCVGDHRKVHGVVVDEEVDRGGKGSRGTCAQLQKETLQERQTI